MPLIDPTGRPVASPKDAPAAAGDSGTSPVKETDIAHFAADVLQASVEVPVIVDFWAPWCGPCKTLGPLLEKVVAETNGAVRMVKVNIDENPEIAQQLRIQSIPTVYAFKNGQPVDGFMGAIPESQVRSFVAGLTGAPAMPDAAGNALETAEAAFAAGDIGKAAQSYGQVLQEDTGNPQAVAGLARCYLVSGDLERAKKTLGLVRPDAAGDDAIRAVEAELELKERAADQADIVPLLAKVEADPGNLQARYDLALALDATGDRDAAIAALLEIVRRDRNWNEQAARKQLLTLFDAMGPADSRTIEARRKLSSLLFA